MWKRGSYWLYGFPGKGTFFVQKPSGRRCWKHAQTRPVIVVDKGPWYPEAF
ncbi:MAG: hypothetical protein QXV01_01685 [Candidatus Bathyarchaeia archaeon]